MYGPLIIHTKEPAKNLNKKYNVTLALTMIIDSIDPKWQTMMLTMMEKTHTITDKEERQGNHKSERERIFDTVEEYKQAIKKGYHSPYLKGISKPMYKYHLINGHPYPLVPPVKATVGETIRLRMISAGNIPHYLHFHGMQFMVVAIDGNSLDHPYKINTVPIFPGQTKDIILQPKISGWWTVHDHAEWGSTNDGHFPGRTMFLIGVADKNGKISNYTPKIGLTQ